MNANLLAGIFAVLNRINRTFSQFLIIVIFSTMAFQSYAVDVTIVYTPVVPSCHGTSTDLTKQINVALSTSGLVFTYFSDKALTVALTDPTNVGPGVYFVKGYRPDPYGFAAVEILITDITIPSGSSASASPNPICAGQTLNLTGIATGATSWSWTGPNSFISSEQSPSIPGITTAGAGVYTLIASNSCFSAAPVNTASVSVDATAPTGVTAIANPNPICAGNALTLTGGANGASTWNWTGPNGFTSSSQNSSIPGITTAGAGVYTLTANNSCGASPIPATATVIVNKVPVATFSYSGTPYCSNAPDPMPSFSGGGVAGVFSSTSGLVFVSSATGQVDLSASTPGLYTVTNTLAAAGNCGQVVATSQITITAQPTITISYNGSPWCSNATVQNVTLVGLAGGTFSAPAGLSINPATGAITPGTSTAGTYLVSYKITAAGCGIITTTTSVTINALPVATFSYTGSPYCNNAVNPSPTFSGGGVAGNFSSTAGLVFVSTASGQVDLTASTPGVYTVTNTTAASGGCSIVTASSGITINALPKATIAYSGSPWCNSAGVQNVTLIGTSAGSYSASPTGLTINSATGAITPGTSNEGNYIVTYTTAVSGGCGAVTATTSVTINSLPNAVITYVGNPFCKTLLAAQPVSLFGTTGGIYSALPAGLAINPVTGAITPGSSTSGSYVVSYTVAAAGGCVAVIATTSVTISDLVSATISYSGAPFCNSLATAQPVTLLGTAGGIFSAATGLALDATTGAITPGTSTAGNYTVTYSLASGGCGIVTTTAPVIITKLPVATFSYAGPYCTNAANPSPTFSNGGVAGVFSSTTGLVFVNTATGQINISASTPGSYIVTNNIAAAGGCNSVQATAPVSINSTIPTGVTATANSNPICAGNALILTGNATGATNWNWTGPNSFTSSQQSPTIPTITTAATGSYILTVSNGCGVAPISTLPIIVKSVTKPTITGNASVCIGANGILYSTEAGNTGYTWTISAGGTIAVDAGNSIVVNWNTAGAQWVKVNYLNANGCAAVLPTKYDVTVNPLPTPVLTGLTSFCAGFAGVVYTTDPGMTNYSWSVSPGGTNTLGGISTSNSITITWNAVGAQWVKVNYTNANGCTASVPAIVDVTISSPPSATISYASILCNSDLTPNPAVIAGSAGGIFSAPAGLSINPSTGAIIPGLSTPGNYTVTYSIAASGQCNAFTTTTDVHIGVAPLLEDIIIKNVTCKGTKDGSLVAKAVGPGTFTYDWTGPSTYTNTGASISGLEPGNYIVKVTGVSGCSKLDTASVTESADLLSVTITGTPASKISASDGTINAIVAGGTPPYTYSWSGPGSFTANTENLTGLIYGVYNLTVTDKNGCSVVGSFILKTPPVAVDDEISTIQNIAATKNIVANDTDADGTIDASSVDLDPLMAGIQTTYDLPTQGTFIVSNTGEVTFTPFLDYYGPVVIQYVVKDNDGLISNVANISVGVISTNTPPVAVDDNVTVAEHIQATGNVFSNDSDPEGKPLKLDNFTIGSTLYSQGTTATISDVGTIIINLNGTFTFTPLEHYFGVVPPVKYKVIDVEGLSATATLYITVTPVNDAPIAVPDNFAAKENNKLEANVLLNDYDIEGDKITIDVIPVQAPAHGTLVLSENGDLSYQPVIDFMGTDTFSYQICDDGNPSLCSTAIVTIVVQKDENCPVLVPNTFTPNGDGIHDYLKVRCLYNYENPVIEIFTRSGNLIFKKDHYGNLDFWGSEDQAFWNGRSENKWNLINNELPVGTYYYVLKLGDGKVLTGYIFLGK